MPQHTSDSSRSGYLRFATTGAPTYDQEFDDQLHQVFVGITGFAGSLVRPRYQDEPAQQPEFNASWLAFGQENVEADTHAYQEHVPLEEGRHYVERDELHTYLLSFYGPRASSFAELTRNSLALDQNRDGLLALGVAVVSMGQATKIPSLVKTHWVNRVDVPITFRRRVRHTVAVLNLQSAQMGLHNEVTVTPIVVKPTTP